ncbi:Rieske [2Fe-2S] iron-sulfur domain-containing protein [Aspergillus ambiguus]|uniref:aromatic ring-hydroxylating oxygenase subunit alpha n=1 Tax=Aspergillus ambiguus TaxID=176160 RepID=UPI003CCD832A
MSSWKNYFGLGNTVQMVEDEKADMRALPASWYTSLEIFELERRAIFSKTWLLTTHSIRLENPGDWLRYDAAGYPFILVKDRQGNINAFHNVCRHRAFPVVTEERGTSRIFSCKYHGWSYGLNGKLAKAPGYQDLEGFDKSKNGLLPIHVHVDNNGFIWVNLDAAEKPEISWEDNFDSIDRLERFADLNWNEYKFDHAWEMEGDYNWKILADNYNECYHGPTRHPDVPSIADLDANSVEIKENGIIHFANSTPEQVAKGLKIASTYHFPNTSIIVSPNLFFMQRFVPISPTKCAMRYEVYRNQNSSDEDFELINQTYKHIMSEDKRLCVRTQESLNNGVFDNGEPHPEMEKGPLYFQTRVRNIVQQHHNREEAVGHEIWSARQTLPETATTSKDDIDFCSKLDASSKGGRDCSNVVGQGGGCCSGMGCQPNEALAY